MTVTDPDAGLLDYFNRSLTPQPPKDASVETYMESLRFYAKNHLRAIIAYAPKSRERDIALERLEETVMWGIKAIALHQESDASEA